MKKSSKKRSSLRKNPYRKEFKSQNLENFTYNSWYIFLGNTLYKNINDPVRIAQFDHYDKNLDPLFDLYDDKTVLFNLSKNKEAPYSIYGPYYSFKEALSIVKKNLVGLHFLKYDKHLQPIEDLSVRGSHTTKKVTVFKIGENKILGTYIKYID